MNNKYIFNENEYNSNDGMITTIWGPPLWHVLHTISFNYPINPTDEQRKHYYKFYKNLQNILPCKLCRDNLKKNLLKMPLTVSAFKNRESLSKYVYLLHETVNQMLGKISGLSYEDVRDRYELFRSRCVLDPREREKHPKIESGCTEPLYGIKSKCVLNIVPRDKKTSSFKLDPKCILSKGGKCKNPKSIKIKKK